MLEQIIETYHDEELLAADGLHDAVIGIDERSMRLIYSVSKCIEILAKEMTVGEAEEYFSNNVECAYVGGKTPIWCWDNFT